ncbi:PilZ domain-containing protein [Stratiformator vulcanicus]|uniref:PilZ domain-containing protein n=1 Tax=Stratiformator vulcanicus TaxID=2527980 RepID=A0A517R660_9PLAN|nr:PilZ domain-containing protein [Stratiformator vulcanicus]QDT39386.1 hypothetical protein Pan189_37930 [Stratiformator vulcanicus]
MAVDPWARPSVQDLHRVLESLDQSESENNRAVERLELNVPAEVKTLRGNTVSAMTREVSREGIGLIHRGAIQPGPVRVKMASETREFDYNVQIEWCSPCENGMFLSGGKFVRPGLPGVDQAE